VVFERPEPELDTVVLAPSYGLTLGVGAIALAASWLNIWLGLVLGLFAIFLAVQATVLRIHFTGTALDLYRGETRLRSFPYADWTHWEIFWSPLPTLFYFNEVNNIHFMPMLFNPRQLRDCAESRCPGLSNASPSRIAEAAAVTESPTPAAAQVEKSAPAKETATD